MPSADTRARPLSRSPHHTRSEGREHLAFAGAGRGSEHQTSAALGSSAAQGLDRWHVAALGSEVAIAMHGIRQTGGQLVAQGIGLDDLVDDQIGR